MPSDNGSDWLDLISRSYVEFEKLVSRVDRSRAKLVMTRVEVDAHEGALWNGFVALMTALSLEECLPEQRAAFLVFSYDCCVQNGGHDHFLDSDEPETPRETLLALHTLRASTHSRILEAAITAKGPVELDQLDSQYYSAEPSLCDILEQHVAAHLSDYIEVESS